MKIKKTLIPAKSTDPSQGKINKSIMESQKEIRRYKSYRTIAMVISLAVHLALAFYLYGIDLVVQEEKSTIALVDSK